MHQIISFIIISYNRPEETIDVVENILHHVNDVKGYTKELIIINNDSTVSYQKLNTYLDQLSDAESSKVVYHLADENLGVPRGRNLGMQMAKGEIMVFIDDDALYVEQNVIETTLDIFNRFEATHNVKIIAYREQNFYSKEYTIPNKDPNRIKEKAFFTNYFIGVAHVIKKEVIEKIGLYIESFKYGVEEYDLCYKALDAGYRIYYSSDITVLHKKSPKGRANTLTLATWQYENKMIVAYKYLPAFYVFTHWIMWTLYFMYHSKANILVWLKSTWSLPAKMKTHPRKVISKETIKYIRSVKGRIYF